MNGNFDEVDFKTHLSEMPALWVSRVFLTLALVSCTLPIASAQDTPQCDNNLELIDAQGTIRKYKPGENSVGLKDAVERVLCETGELRGVTLDKADLSGLNASNSHLYEVSIVDVDLSHANLDGATIERGSLDQANLQNSSAIGAVFIGPNMVGTSWDCADFTRATFIDVRLRNVSGQSSIMRDVVFHRYAWENTNFEFADLRKAKLFGYADRSSNIHQANISGTDTRVFTDLFRGQLEEVFGPNGACYVAGDPPVDSSFRNWRVRDGALWRGERLMLSICDDQTLTRKDCKH